MEDGEIVSFMSCKMVWCLDGIWGWVMIETSLFGCLRRGRWLEMVKGPWFWVKSLLGEIMGHLGLSHDFSK